MATTGTAVFPVTTNSDGSTTSAGDITGTIDPEKYAFTKGLTYLGSHYEKMTDEQKVALFKSTSLKDAALSDLMLLDPFTVRLYYED